MEIPSPDILVYIFSKLNKRDLREARLVCKQWNSQVLSILPRKLFFNVAKQGWKLSRFAVTDPRVCSSMEFNNKPFPWLATRQIPPREFFEAFGTAYSLRRVSLRDPWQVLEMSQASSRGLLPDLVELRVGFWVGKFLANNTLEANVFPKLKTLLISCQTNVLVGSEEYAFWQSVIDAAPNVLKLQAPQHFDLSRLKKLKNWDVSSGKAIYGIAMADMTGILQVIPPVCSTLKVLTIQTNCQPLKQAPPLLPNVTTFTFISEEGKNLAKVLPRFLSNLPSLRNLTIKMKEMPDSDSHGFLGNEKRNLHFLEICNPAPKSKEDIAQWLDGWKRSLSLFRIKTMSVILPNANTPEFLVEEWIDGILGLSVHADTLILEYEKMISFTMMLRHLRLARFECGEEDRAPKTLEIHNGFYNYEKLNEREAYILQFPNIMKKLIGKWKKIRIKYFEIPEPFLSRILQDVRDLNHVVEVFPLVI